MLSSRMNLLSPTRLSFNAFKSPRLYRIIALAWHSDLSLHNRVFVLVMIAFAFMEVPSGCDKLLCNIFDLRRHVGRCEDVMTIIKSDTDRLYV